MMHDIERYREPESQSHGWESAKKLIDAKVGDDVEITVPLFGMLALAYSTGKKISYDAEGNMSIPNVSTDNSSNNITPSMTIMEGGPYVQGRQYENSSDYLYQNSVETFINGLSEAVRLYLIKQEEERLNRNYQKKPAGAIRLALQKKLFPNSYLVTNGIDVELDFLDYARKESDKIANNCFEPNMDTISAFEGYNRGKKAILVTCTVTKIATLPFTSSDLSDFNFAFR